MCSSDLFQINRWGRFGNTQGFSINLRPTGGSGKTAARVLCMSSGGRLQPLEAEQC